MISFVVFVTLSWWEMKDDVFFNSLGLLFMELSLHIRWFSFNLGLEFQKRMIFLKMYHRKTVVGLKECMEDGVFIVYVIVRALEDGGEFCYSACKCNRKVTSDSRSYYCLGCDKHVYQVIPIGIKLPWVSMKEIGMLCLCCLILMFTTLLGFCDASYLRFVWLGGWLGRLLSLETIYIPLFWICI